MTTIRTVFRDTPPVESVPVSPWLTGEYDADGMLVAMVVTQSKHVRGKANADVAEPVAVEGDAIHPTVSEAEA